MKSKLLKYETESSDSSNDECASPTHEVVEEANCLVVKSSRYQELHI